MAVWYDDALKTRDFAEALEQAEYADADEILKKPYRFEEEYKKWVENDYPGPEDSNWDAFIESLQNEGEGE